LRDGQRFDGIEFWRSLTGSDIRAARPARRGTCRLWRCLIPGSSVVEQAAVNRLAGGSNPSPGANWNRELGHQPPSSLFVSRSEVGAHPSDLTGWAHEIGRCRQGHAEKVMVQCRSHSVVSSDRSTMLAPVRAPLDQCRQRSTARVVVDVIDRILRFLAVECPWR
jgi:hypothetical protein